jgi:hypothetical protein
MPAPLAYSAAASASPDTERRSRGRVRQQGVVCDLGVVLDLSAGGMRVLSTRGHDGQMNIRIWTIKDSVTVRADVVWSKRVGFRRHLVGLKFVAMSESDAAALSTIAIAHRALVAIHPGG